MFTHVIASRLACDVPVNLTAMNRKGAHITIDSFPSPMPAHDRNSSMKTTLSFKVVLCSARSSELRMSLQSFFRLGHGMSAGSFANQRSCRGSLCMVFRIRLDFDELMKHSKLPDSMQRGLCNGATGHGMHVTWCMQKRLSKLPNCCKINATMKVW